MKAEIFYMADDSDVPVVVRKLLREYLYENIEIVPCAFVSSFMASWEIKEKMYSQTTRYLKLLQASISPATGYSLAIDNSSPYGFYVYSYAKYSGRKQACTDQKLYPALAVRDRMLIVPHDLATSLASDAASSLFRSLQAGGVAEADFKDPAALTASVKEVSEMLRSEIVQEFLAYRSFRRGDELAPKAIEEHLGIEWQFIQDALERRSKESTFYQHLNCQVDNPALVLKRWTKLLLTISNDSDNDLPDLVVKVAGPVEVKPDKIRAQVAAHGNRQIPIAVKANEEGDFPVEVTLVAPKDDILSEWIPVHHLWLTVAPRSS